jgi:hypothetical protein
VVALNGHRVEEKHVLARSHGFDEHGKANARSGRAACTMRSKGLLTLHELPWGCRLTGSTKRSSTSEHRDPTCVRYATRRLVYFT